MKKKPESLFSEQRVSYFVKRSKNGEIGIYSEKKTKKFNPQTNYWFIAKCIWNSLYSTWSQFWWKSVAILAA